MDGRKPHKSPFLSEELRQLSATGSRSSGWPYTMHRGHHQVFSVSYEKLEEAWNLEGESEDLPLLLLLKIIFCLLLSSSSSSLLLFHMGSGHMSMSNIGHVEDKGQIAEDRTQVIVLDLPTE